MPKRLKGGASVPAQNRAAVLAALNDVGGKHTVDPAAIAGVIHTESVWDTHCITGIYIGLTQVGPELPQLLHMSRTQFLNLQADDQIEAYGSWLEHYKFTAKMTKDDIDVTALPLPRQAALLQGMQFAPNDPVWQRALGRGNLTVRTTKSKQASFLGDTSIAAMERYYSGFFSKYPPVYLSGISASIQE